jgi:NAD-dependent deacetylase
VAKKKLIVLTGAGVSAESGLKTFRDSDGLWEGFNVEDVATPQAWNKNPEMVLDFYNERRRNILNAVPNAAHKGLAKLENYFDVAVITQNIDDLHERAGSSRVIHLHGEIFKMRSAANPSLIYEIREDIKYEDLAADGRQLRPHIVWFGESVPMMSAAIPLVESADIFVVVGTSLAVYPAAGLISYAKHSIPKYIIDKKIPDNPSVQNLTCIEKPATEAVADLLDLLLPDKKYL